MNNGLICIAVCARTVDDLIEQLRLSEPLADVLEVRFDCIAKDELAHAADAVSSAAISKPLIATYRSSDQGGHRDITAGDRLEFWRALPDGFLYADLEADIIHRLDIPTKIIASQHDFNSVPLDLGKLCEQLADTKAQIIKIAATAHDICDAIPIWKLLENARPEGREIVPIAMGEAGKWTRILGLAHGAFLTYAASGTGKETASGQFTADELRHVYRVQELDRDTRVYGVIGDPVSASLSPFMHNAGFAAAALNAVFLPLEVRDLDAFMQRMVLPETREIDVNFAGFAVTMPHKQAIQKYLTKIDPVAAKIGAVNTVKVDGGSVTGCNSDAHGFIAPLKARMPDLKDAHVAVLGAGGAARAVVYALQEEQAEITLFARDPNKARLLADEFNIRVADLGTIAQRSSTIDIFVNTTPLGMPGTAENKSALTANDLSGVRFVYDLVTRRDDTPLIREAIKAGVPAIGGVEMLIAQGLRQFEIWTGLEPPAVVMRKAVLDRLR